MTPDPPRYSEPAELRSFGRKRGRKPSARQERLLAEALPRVTADLSRPCGLTALPFRETWLEIGFGGAEHLVWQADQNRDVLVLGCEPFEDGVIKALAAIEDKKLANVRLHADDARPLLRWLPERSIARAFILFPDPWPKKKHAKRRLVSPHTLDVLARVMRPGAELRLATDIGDYARTVLIAVASEPRFRWTAAKPSDWRDRPADWPATRYEAKAVTEGRRRYFFRFVRV
jgi:tRNA (guanine-N7-)-methyltransferase